MDLRRADPRSLWSIHLEQRKLWSLVSHLSCLLGYFDGNPSLTDWQAKEWKVPHAQIQAVAVHQAWRALDIPRMGVAIVGKNSSTRLKGTTLSFHCIPSLSQSLPTSSACRPSRSHRVVPLLFSTCTNRVVAYPHSENDWDSCHAVCEILQADRGSWDWSGFLRFVSSVSHQAIFGTRGVAKARTCLLRPSSALDDGF